MADTKVVVAGCSAARRRIMRQRAEDAGLTVIAEWTEEGADRSLGSGHGADLVLADRSFLERGGWRRPDKGRQGGPVIAVAAGGDRPEWFEDAVQRGVSDYLVLPFAAKDLKEKVERVLAAQSKRRRRMPEVYGVHDLEKLYEAARPHRDVLSQDEIDSLLSSAEPEGGKSSGDELSAAMEEEAAQTEVVPPAPEERPAPEGVVFEQAAAPIAAADTGRITTSYDFKHPARVNKTQLRTLESIHDNFARMLSHSLSGLMRAVVDVDTAFVDQTTYAEFIMSLSNPCCSYQFTLNPHGGQVIMDWAMPIVCGIVDRFQGGKGSSQGVDPRQLTQIEMGLMAKAVREAIWDLDRTWDFILHDRINNIELETNPEFMQITAPSEIVILLAFEVNSTNASGLISLCYPFFTLEPILPLLGRREQDISPGRRKVDPRPANRLRLGDMDLELTAELGRTRIPAGEAADLHPGDVIRLNTRANDPACVFVGGQPRFLGWPMEEGGEVKLHLAGKIPPHLTHKFGTINSDG
ncbi:FliM/FliN family flagellar motor switch protein [Candidatus Latescibacterota bacterium]